jgi:hypothetical protein
LVACGSGGGVGAAGQSLCGMLAWCGVGDGGVESAADAGDAGGHLGAASADFFQHFGLAGRERHFQGGARWYLDAVEYRVDEPGGGARGDVSGLDAEHGVDQVGMGFDDRLGEEATTVLDEDVLTVQHGFSVQWVTRRMVGARLGHQEQRRTGI